jgi:hypothetical protein
MNQKFGDLAACCWRASDDDTVTAVRLLHECVPDLGLLEAYAAITETMPPTLTERERIE